MATRLRNSRTRPCDDHLRIGSRYNRNRDDDRLDKKDEVWCYVLIKLFTSMLENPEEASRLVKTTEHSEAMFEIDLASAVQQLKAAIFKTKTSMNNETSSRLGKMGHATSYCSSEPERRIGNKGNKSSNLPRIESVSSLSADSSIIDYDADGNGNKASGDVDQSKFVGLVLKALMGK